MREKSLIGYTEKKLFKMFGYSKKYPLFLQFPPIAQMPLKDKRLKEIKVRITIEEIQ